MDWLAFLERKRTELTNTGHIIDDYLGFLAINKFCIFGANYEKWSHRKFAMFGESAEE